MSKEWKGEERRSHPRVRVESVGSTPASVVATAVVDLSLSGALLEVPSSLSSESRCVVHVALEDGRSAEVEGKVVRSYVHGFEKGASGLPAVKYRAAIQFLDLEPRERGVLEELVQAGGQGKVELSPGPGS